MVATDQQQVGIVIIQPGVWVGGIGGPFQIFHRRLDFGVPSPFEAEGTVVLCVGCAVMTYPSDESIDATHVYAIIVGIRIEPVSPTHVFDRYQHFDVVESRTTHTSVEAVREIVPQHRPNRVSGAALAPCTLDGNTKER